MLLHIDFLIFYFILLFFLFNQTNQKLSVLFFTPADLSFYCKFFLFSLFQYLDSCVMIIHSFTFIEQFFCVISPLRTLPKKKSLSCPFALPPLDRFLSFSHLSIPSHHLRSMQITAILTLLPFLTTTLPSLPIGRKSKKKQN